MLKKGTWACMRVIWRRRGLKLSVHYTIVCPKIPFYLGFLSYGNHLLVCITKWLTGFGMVWVFTEKILKQTLVLSFSCFAFCMKHNKLYNCLSSFFSFFPFLSSFLDGLPNTFLVTFIIHYPGSMWPRSDLFHWTH